MPKQQDNHIYASSESVPEWAKKPILGFSTWSTQLLDNVAGYGGKNISPWFNEKNILDISNTMRQKLPRYEYINLDSGWSNTCDAYGRWMYRTDLFPNGLAKLSSQLAENGHRLGIYILPGIPAWAVDHDTLIKGTTHRIGEYTRQRKQGNVFKGMTYMPDVHDEVIQAYYDSMGDLFASWGVRYVKIDGCGPGSGDPIYPDLAPDCRETLRMMGQSFKRHDIWVELSWYLDPRYADEWATMANGARIYIDIESYSTRTMTSASRVLERFQYVARWPRAVLGPHSGFYIDLDAVLVGMTTPWNARCIDGLDSDLLRQSYIAFWALVSSVFCIGADPRLLPDKYIDMLHHPIILDIQQSGIVAVPLPFTDYWHYRQVWWKRLPLSALSSTSSSSVDHYVVCVGLFNTCYYPITMNNHSSLASWLKMEIDFKLSDVLQGTTMARITNVWTGEDIGVTIDKYTTWLEPGECQLLLLYPILD
ncbi:glycoside hydrolase superfamily [Halteromyces radiatus]|uniref:glycoside hydrolase superfamily n=1 Tax=Halteromyces radiatus TaxID=101107 RepID=UPI002220D30A|nr:glycoside hydrolase superfamily [Halteromyces radiatus]KAI8096413.1 glycoside hydrolase superfamily [Halteromyces radiatus]